MAGILDSLHESTTSGLSLTRSLLLCNEQNLCTWMHHTRPHQLHQLVQLVDQLLDLPKETCTLLDVDTRNAIYVVRWIIAHWNALSTGVSTVMLGPPVTLQNIVN